MARAAALGASCARRDEADGGILRYANTAQVVEDMVEIIEKEGEWRAAEAARLVADIEDEAVRRDVLERTAYDTGSRRKEKLQYWGMSYGTLIGATFSALHPDRVGRVVLDGVVDPADHYSGGWLTQLLDSDKIITQFSEYCFQAGPEKCPLYDNSGVGGIQSPDDIEARVTAILLSLKKSPIPLILPSSSAEQHTSGPELITYGDVHLYLLGSMYFTYSMTEPFWHMLLALESRNTTSPVLLNLAKGKQAMLQPTECIEEGDEYDANRSSSGSIPRVPCVPYNSLLGPNQAIGCMDIGGHSHNLTQESYTAYLTQLESQSRWISPSWARNKLGCLGYQGVEPAWRPNLTFEAQQWDNPAHPLLLIGNAHDPVTPLRNARRVSRDLFPGGSVVLRQGSEGHCSSSNPSLCTARVVRAYFQAGALPAEGSVCEPEMRPFLGCVQDHGCEFGKGEDADLWEALVQMADPFGLRKEKEDETEGKVGMTEIQRFPQPLDGRFIHGPLLH